MGCLQSAGRWLCLAVVSAALVAVIVSGASALSYGQSDGALVAAFFGALVALVSSLWVCARFFGGGVQVEEPVRPVWYVGQPAASAAPSVILRPLAPRTPGWGPYRTENTPGDSVLSPPNVPAIDDTQKITVTPPVEAAYASDTRPMKAIQTTADTRRIEPTPTAPPERTSQPNSLPEAPEPHDTESAEPPVRPSTLAL